MQKIWSKVLAGEVKEPTTFSLRTLNCLRNMSVSDAKLFELVHSIMIEDDCVISDMDFLKKNGICYDDILKLDECGLINSSGNIESRDKVTTDWRKIFDFGEYILEGKTNNEVYDYSFPAYPLTTAGKELCRISKKTLSIDKIKDISKYIVRNNLQLQFRLYKSDSGETINKK